MTKLSVSCRAFRPLYRNTLRGFCEVQIAELRLTVHDVAVHARAKAQVREGKLVTNAEGRVQYWPVLEFTSRDVSNAFSRAVIDAVLRAFPSALEDREVAA